MKQAPHEFVIVLDGVHEIDAGLEDAVYESGCGDGLLASRNGVVFVEFSRVACSMEMAILSALRDLASCHPAIPVSHVEPDDNVTASEFARRLGCSREYVRLLALGERGGGNFPAPVSGVTGTAFVWSWADVLRWLKRHDMLPDESWLIAAEVIRDINRTLERRRCRTDARRERALKSALGGRS